MKKESSLADIAFYLALGALFGWIIAKSLGIISSPPWVNMVPYASAFVVLGVMHERLRNMGSGIGELKTGQEEIKKSAHNIDKRVTVLEEIRKDRRPVSETKLDSARDK